MRKITRRISGKNRRAALADMLLITTALVSAVAGGGGAPALAQEQAEQQAAPAAPSARNFNIPAQPLADALVVFARQSGLEVDIDSDLARDLQAPAVAGAMRADEALARLLAGTGLVAGRAGERTLVIRQAAAADAGPDADALALDRLMIEGGVSEETGARRDARKKDDIFDLDLSTDYLGKQDIDRFRGLSTADVFQGLTNVYSGAARNGGALDANIRGIQGAGRAPVIIDGTEQAIVAYRGYSGFSNRSYIDPSLIAGVQALKGPVSVREVNSQSGGAIVIKTLDARDILRPGQTFGAELRLEAGNNSARPRLPTLRTGQDARKVPGFIEQPGNPYSAPFADPTLRVAPRTRRDNDPFSFGGDRAARIAAAGRKGDFDFFGAWAYRERGNYFSGKNNADYYSEPPDAKVIRTQNLASQYRPGYEVTNSSSRMQSWLLKTTWRIAFDQAVQLGYRNTRSATGEIMPSRIINTGALEDRRGYVQWPLSQTRIQALNLEYKYTPQTPWLDMHANLWASRANSNTYSSGGFPNIPRSREDPTLINTALRNTRNNRWGLTFSNKMALAPSLDLTVGGHYQYEKLRPYDDDDVNPAQGFLLFGSGGRRAGNRQEYRANFQLEWRPTGFLTFNGGVGHAGYRTFDDGLHARLKGGGRYSQSATIGYKSGYELYAFGKEANEARLRASFQEAIDFDCAFGPEDCKWILDFVQRVLQPSLDQYERNPQRFSVGEFTREWLADANGKFRRANMPVRCDRAALSDFDLDAVIREIVADPEQSDEILIPAVRRALSEVGCSGATKFSGPIYKDIELKDPAELKARHAAGWEPYLSATLKLSDDIRLYGRYAERLRFASLFEGTVGFSAAPSLFQPLKPERIRAWEAAYIQDFGRLFGLYSDDQRADFKLVYFHNTVKDVIDRDGSVFVNYDRQVIDGVELQARLDTGRLFLTLGAARILNNKVIDESAATVEEFVYSAPRALGSNARTHGFGHLQNQGIPPLTLNLTLGGRFFDRRLELGARATYYSAHDSRQLYLRLADGRLDRINLRTRSFDKTLVLDAYASYKFNERLKAELVSTNLTDQFYADPLGLSDMPAPGRQIRLNFSWQF